VAFSGIFPHLDNQRNDAKNLKRSLLYGRFIFQKSRVLDILGWPTPSGCSLHLNGTVVERQTSFTDDTGRTGRTRPNFLEDVGKSARAWQVMPHPPSP
jgi:hypothetical protein